MDKSLTELKQIILNTDSSEELFAANLDLTEKVNGLYQLLKSGAYDESYVYGEINIAKTLRKICEKKIETMNSEQHRMNHNFRMLAKSYLSEKDYQLLKSLSKLPIKEGIKQIS